MTGTLQFFRKYIAVGMIVVVMCFGLLVTSPKVEAALTNEAQIAQLTVLLNALRVQLAALIAAQPAVSVGSSVQTAGMVNVRSTGSMYGNLAGVQPLGMSGRVTAGPQVQGGYTWWYVDYAAGADGWSAGNWLRATTQTVGSVLSVSDAENPLVKGTASNGQTVNFSIGGPSGDKVYSSGPVTVRDGAWTHTVSTDLPDGTYKLLLYVNSALMTTKTFVITNSTPTLPQVSWVEPSRYATIDSRGDVRTVYLDSTSRTEPDEYDTLLVRWDREFKTDSTASCTIVAWYEDAYRSITLTETYTTKNIIGEYIPVTERYYNSNLEQVNVDCISATDSFKEVLAVSVDASSSSSDDDDDDVSFTINLNDEDTDLDTNLATKVSDDEGVFTLDFSITAKYGDMDIPNSIGDSSSYGFTYQVIDGDDDELSASYTNIDNSSQSITSSASQSNGRFIIEENETEQFTLTVRLDPVQSDSYMVRLEEIRFYENSDRSDLESEDVESDDIETDRLEIDGSGIPYNGSTGTYKSYRDERLFVTTVGVKESDAYENCLQAMNNNPTMTVYCTWNDKIVGDNRTAVISKMAIGVGAYQGTLATTSTSTHPQGVVSVTIPDPGTAYADKSVTLVLTAHEPVLWNIKGLGKRTIKSVFVSGQYNQQVKGIAAGVPIVKKSFEGGHTTYFDNYQSSGASFDALQNYVIRTYDTKFRNYKGAYTQNDVRFTVAELTQ